MYIATLLSAFGTLLIARSINANIRESNKTPLLCHYAISSLNDISYIAVEGGSDGLGRRDGIFKTTVVN